MPFGCRTKTVGVIIEMFLLTVVIMVLVSGVGVLGGIFASVIMASYFFPVSLLYSFFSSVPNIAFYVFSGFGL